MISFPDDDSDETYIEYLPDQTAQLTITEFDTGDAGTYKCKLGKWSQNVTIYTQCKT